jgi:hypothetical protein
MLLSACHYDPYPWPRPGQPSAAALENQLNERDSLQAAANDLITVAAAVGRPSSGCIRRPDGTW